MGGYDLRIETTGKGLAAAISQVLAGLAQNAQATIWVDTIHFALVQLDQNTVALLDKVSGRTYTTVATCQGTADQHEPQLDILVGRYGTPYKQGGTDD